ncbi:hypothetical protein EV401DRAFT_1895698 [Pisolithus croceorrhizus]|nr:hypothetical protein EV401DRAFT_1895698 [Pisolithus croceorrhizus]
MSEIETPAVVQKVGGEIWASEGYQRDSNKWSGAREGQKGLVGLQLVEQRVGGGLRVQLMCCPLYLYAMAALGQYSSRTSELTYRGVRKLHNGEYANSKGQGWDKNAGTIGYLLAPVIPKGQHPLKGVDPIWTKGSHMQDLTMANSGEHSDTVAERSMGLVSIRLGQELVGGCWSGGWSCWEWCGSMGKALERHGHNTLGGTYLTPKALGS